MRNIGIIVSGGPAPGINGVIAACVSEASERGIHAFGFRNGFREVCNGGADALVALDPEIVERSAQDGGSIIGTSRLNPMHERLKEESLLDTLSTHEISHLIVIGGDGSAYVSHQLSRKYPHLSIVQVPKTIDNDLLLPHNYPSFGFETARWIGTGIVNVLKSDAETCQRWFLAETMGRQAGFLALGIGVAAGTPLTLIPEEFMDRLYHPSEIAEIIFRTMLKRHRSAKPYGVIVLAEGILDRLDPVGTELLQNCPRDELGRITYSELELGEVLIPYLEEQCSKHGIETVVKTKNIGYELRCAPPIAFDIEYTRMLGYSAVNYLAEGKAGILVTRDYDDLGYKPLEEMVKHGKIISRTVSLESDFYKVARSFMTQ